MITLNGTKIDPTIFPDRTIQVWKLDRSLFRKTNYIEWQYEDDSELMLLFQLKILLNTYSYDNILVVPYLPYGRQDKDISNEATFGLHAFAQIINAMKFSKVVSFDVHSDIAEKLIHNFSWDIPYLDPIIESHHIDYLVYPDKGALCKYAKLIHYPFKYAHKVRDQLTGEITKLEFHDDVDGCNLLIVDDIADGGGTFVALSKELIDRGADEVNLYVSHGLFSKGIQILRDAGIKNIYTRKGLIE